MNYDIYDARKNEFVIPRFQATGDEFQYFYIKD